MSTPSDYAIDENGKRWLSLPDEGAFEVVFSGRESLSGEWPAGAFPRVAFAQRMLDGARAAYEPTEAMLIRRFAA